MKGTNRLLIYFSIKFYGFYVLNDSILALFWQIELALFRPGNISNQNKVWNPNSIYSLIHGICELFSFSSLVEVFEFLSIHGFFKHALVARKAKTEIRRVLNESDCRV